MGQPLVFPHGVTVYDPEKCWNGYTLVPLINDGVLLFDMNGNEIRRWNMQAMPAKMLPGGYVMGLSGYRHPDYGMQDGVNLLEIDYDGNIVWEFDHLEEIDDPGRDHRWMARQHHDYQREGNPVGYYVPGMDANPLGGKTLILCHQTIRNPLISDKKLLDDMMIEVDWEGNILWKWSISDHFEELGFDEAAKNVLFRDPNMRSSDGGVGDYLHVNCMSYLGPNKWYEHGDMRFKPDNVIFDCREANILAILDKESGKIRSTTAADLARILRYCISLSPAKEEFLAITRAPSHAFSDLSGTRSFSCVNHNALLTSMEGAVSGKTGFTGKAGYCYVGAVKKDEKLFIAALLDCGWPPHRTYKWQDMRKLVTYGDKNFEYKEIEKTGLGEETAVLVENGVESRVKVEIGTEHADRNSLHVLLGNDEKIQVRTKIAKLLHAPVREGTPVGQRDYMVDGIVIDSDPVVTAGNVELWDFEYAEKIVMGKFWM